MKTLHIIWCLTMASALLTLNAYSGSFSLGIDPNPATVGQPSRLVITSSAALTTIETLPTLSGLRWIGGPQQSSSIQIINGQRRDEYKTMYTFVADRDGVLTLPDFNIIMNGKRYPTRGFQIRVMPYDGSAVEKLIDLVVTYNGAATPPAEMVTGQVLRIDLKLLVDARLRIVDNARHGWNFTDVRNYFPEVNLEGVIWRNYRAFNPHHQQFLYEQMQDMQHRGSPYRLFQYSCAFYPLSSGTLEGSIRHAVPYIANQQGDPVLSFFSGNDVAKRHPLHIQIPPIRVRPLPAAPARGSYLGLVGDWQVDLSLSDKEMTLGKGVTLTLTVAGTGNIEGLTAPQLHLPGFNIYEPEVIREPGRQSHRGTITWVLVPRSIDSSLPTIALHTYNPTTQAYATSEFNLPLNIHPGASTEASIPGIIDSSVGTPTQPVNAVRRMADIQYIKTAPGAMVVLPVWRNQLPLALMFFAAGPLLCLVLWGLCRRHERLTGSEATRRRLQALRQRRRLFRRLQRASDEELPELVRQELVPHLAAVLLLPPGTTITELREKVPDEELRELLQQAESGGFAPGVKRGPLDRHRLLQAAARLACLLVLLTLLPLQAVTLEDAATAYNRGDYEAAAAIYDELRQEDGENAALCYNLGNCAYGLGNLGEAVAWYERARRLAPRDSDILVNLNFVRRQLDLPPAGQADSPLQLLAAWRDAMRPDEWLLMAAAMWLLAWLVPGVMRWRGRAFHQAMLLPAAICLLAIVAILQQQRSTYAPGQAVIVNHDTPIYRLPRADQEPSSLQLREGEYARIMERRGDWIRIRLAQNEGWIAAGSLQEYW